MNRFTFHAAGQGLFYTGSIDHEDNNRHLCYNFVYDCGTESDEKSLESEIDDYVLDLSNREYRTVINSITISHLHSDHMNKLKYLLDCCKKYNISVKEINLPYIEHTGNILQLILAYELLVKDKSYETFSLINSMYLNENQNNRESTPKINFIGKDENREDNELLEQTEDDDFIYKIYAYNTGSFKKHWNFIYLNKQIKYKERMKLESEIQNEIKHYNNNNPKANITNISDMILNINNAKTIKAIKTIYEKVFGKGNSQNLTSTVMVHYPSTILTTRLFHKTRCCCPKCHYITHTDITFLCGDAEFTDNMNQLIDKYIPHNRNYILQVPHHGSYNNWNSLSSGIKMNCDVFIIPFGYHNKHRHPDGATVLEIMKLCDFNTLFCATQYRGMMYELTF